MTSRKQLSSLNEDCHGKNRSDYCSTCNALQLQQAAGHRVHRFLGGSQHWADLLGDKNDFLIKQVADHP
jgi:hypothetical protein